MRCPSCGARNSEDASWCTQCYVVLTSGRPVEDGPSRDDGGPGVPGAPQTAPATLPQPPGDAHRGDPGVGARDVRERDGAVEWRCRSCERWNLLSAGSCAVCGTARHGFGAADAERVDGSDTNVVAASLAFPGLGHVLVGRTGTGLARALLAVLWLVGGLLIVVNDPGRAGLPGWVLLLSVAVLWVASVLDAQRLEAGDERQLLGTRGLASLVVGVTLALVVAAGVALFTGS